MAPPATVTGGTEPRVTPADVLAWLDRTGAASAEAVSHFWPGLDERDRAKKTALLRTWRHRQKAPPAPRREPPQRPAPAPPAPRVDPPPPPPPEAPPEPDPWAAEPSAASLPLVELLAQRVSYVAGDLAYLRARGRVAEAAKLEVTLCDLRDRLEAARIAAAGRLHLERSPAAIAAELARSRPLLDLQLEKERRLEARRAAEAAAAAARERTL